MNERITVHLKRGVVVTSKKSYNVIDTITDRTISFQNVIFVANVMQHDNISAILWTENYQLNGKNDSECILITIIFINFLKLTSFTNAVIYTIFTTDICLYS